MGLGLLVTRPLVMPTSYRAICTRNTRVSEIFVTLRTLIKRLFSYNNVRIPPAYVGFIKNIYLVCAKFLTKEVRRVNGHTSLILIEIIIAFKFVLHAQKK